MGVGGGGGDLEELLRMIKIKNKQVNSFPNPLNKEVPVFDWISTI